MRPTNQGMCKDGRVEHARLENARSPVRWCGLTAESSVWAACGDLRVLKAYVGMCSYVFLLCVRASRKGDISSHRPSIKADTGHKH
jgi:hypothetical protein